MFHHVGHCTDVARTPHGYKQPQTSPHYWWIPTPPISNIHHHHHHRHHHHHHQEQPTSNAESFSMSSLISIMSDVLRIVLIFTELTGFSMANLYNSNVAWWYLGMVASKSNRCQGHMTGSTSVLPPMVMGRPCHAWRIYRWPVHLNSSSHVVLYQWINNQHYVTPRLKCCTMLWFSVICGLFAPWWHKFHKCNGGIVTGLFLVDSSAMIQFDKRRVWCHRMFRIWQ